MEFKYSRSSSRLTLSTVNASTAFKRFSISSRFISGCSIVNQIEGVKVVGGSADNRIVFEGNTFQGNGYSDITLDGATGVDVHGNFFNSGNQWGQIKKSPKLEDGNYAVWVKNGPTSCTVKYNCFGKTYHDDDGAVKSTSGVESADNLF